MVHMEKVQVESALLFEKPEQIFARVFRHLRPQSPVPEVRVEFRRFAGAHSFARLVNGRIEVRVADLLQDAPAPVMESLAHVLLGKLLRRPVAPQHARTFRLYLQRRDVSRRIDLARRERGRRRKDQPRGACYDLEKIFEDLNRRYFGGTMKRPVLAWSARPSRTALGRCDTAHNTIVVSRLLDSPDTPRVVLEYVMYHEMLHLQYPVEHRNGRRKIHSEEFRKAERRFEAYEAARTFIRNLLSEEGRSGRGLARQCQLAQIHPQGR